MALFETEIINPDRQIKVSSFFRVIAPAFILVGLVAFIHLYYATNVRPVPPLLNLPLTAAAIFFPLLWLVRWYSNHYRKVGSLKLTPEHIEFELDRTQKRYTFNVNEVSNIAFLYEGYSGVTSPARGLENQMSFKYNGTPYSFNFRLSSEEKASDIANVLKDWDKKGIQVTETNTEGKKRKYLIYSAE